MSHCINNFICLTNDSWIDTQEGQGCKKFIEHLEHIKFDFPDKINSLETVDIHSCPIGNYLINIHHKKISDRIEVVLVLSKDKEIRKKCSQLFRRIQINYIFESTVLKTIARILELDVKLLIVDYNQDNEHYENLFKIVKRIRPRLPMMTFFSESTENILEQFRESGIHHIQKKPLQFNRIIDFISMVAPS